MCLFVAGLICVLVGGGAGWLVHRQALRLLRCFILEHNSKLLLPDPSQEPRPI
jgi:hypothetical protein